MRAYCSRLMQSDEGSGTMACVMLIALAAALIATVASVGGALLCRSRARQLESCAVEGDDIVVTVSVPLRLPFMSRVSQRSRAGPISCE